MFAEAKASDDYRASGKQPRPLEGIPFTVKDSYKVKGMIVAAASPAFAKLEATSDAAIVELLRKAGAVVLGKTNMPPMADGGCQRGLYGRTESPYNQKYMCTAYASGSSYGCGVSTAVSLAAFGFAGESVTSGRSSASNNALVAYTPSFVPHTRTMADLFYVLNIVVADDDAAGDADFWRSQPYALWKRARADLERLGATVIETDFPLYENYTKQDFPGQSMNVPNLSQEWAARERNRDKDIPNFTSVELDKIHPHIAPMDNPSQHTEAQNQVRYEDMVAAVKSRGDSSLADLPGCRDALQALEAMRKKDLED
ncbi:hypothetical protein ACHAPI_010123 [Fusarium lateritium]